MRIERLVPRLRVARSFAARAVGLLGKTRLADDEGLWLGRCSAIHTFGMRMAIDVVFIDRHSQVVGVATVKPWRWAARIDARAVLELAAGRADALGLVPGLILTSTPDARA
jgi:uncharacterized membrane protein (UPF0127 family)